jgi:hypothetical protein
MARQACKTVYKFNELSDEAKDKAIEDYRQDGFGYEWWDYIFEDAKRMGSLMGITVDKIYFSGFSSQGDGACFEGSYEYVKGSVKAIREETGDSDKDLAAIAKGLQAEQRRNFYGLSANVKQRGHYSHEFCTEIDVQDNRDNAPWQVSDEVEEAIKDLLRDFMRWIYRSLEREWHYMNSDAAITENIEANEYEFLENGRMYY